MHDMYRTPMDDEGVRRFTHQLRYTIWLLFDSYKAPLSARLLALIRQQDNWPAD